MAATHQTMSILLILSALVVFDGTAPLGHALSVGGLIKNIDQIQIEGFVACSATGNSAPSGGILGAAGVLVGGTCNGNTGTIGMAVTNTTGFFVITVEAVQGILFDPAAVPCFAVVNLPVTGTSCKAFIPVGILQAPLTFLSVVQNAEGGLVAVFSAGKFQLLPHN